MHRVLIGSVMLLAALILQACASIPERPAFTMPEEGRVGYLIELNGPPTHSHVGTTVFNNFNQTYDVNWELGDHARNVLESELLKYGLIGIDLEALGYSVPDFTGLVRQAGGHWGVDTDRDYLFRELKEVHQIAAVVVMSRLGRHVVFLECGMYGCTERLAEGMGLFTRGIMGLLTFHAVPAVDLRVIVLDPPVELAAYDPLRAFRTVKGNTVPVNGLSRPNEFRQLTEDELLPFREAIERQLDVIVENVLVALKSGSG